MVEVIQFQIDGDGKIVGPYGHALAMDNIADVQSYRDAWLTFEVNVNEVGVVDGWHVFHLYRDVARGVRVFNSVCTECGKKREV